MPYRKPTSRYFTSTTGSMGGRPYFRLYKGDVSSYTKDRSSAASSFRRKCSCGIRSSIVTMCSFSCIQPTACFFFYSTTADDIFPLCQQPQHGPKRRQCGRLFLYPKTNKQNGGTYMEFFNSAIDILKILVMALGAGLAVWGVINLLEGYGSDNPAANAHVR